MSIEFLESDFDKVSYLTNLLTSRATGLAADSREFELLRHELLSNSNISHLLPQWLKQHRNLDTFWGFIKQKFSTYAERRTFISKEFTPALDALEFGHTPPPTGTFPTTDLIRPRVVARNKRKVFIVHGRDNEAKQEVSRFIEKLGLEAIVLHEQASSGMTIIEKIEHYSNDADFALVLYTACDHGRGAHESKVYPRNRARQNVVFEHGYLMAKL
nr:nucleotide-binding protein [uncultured Halomonas sp.]